MSCTVLHCIMKMTCASQLVATLRVVRIYSLQCKLLNMEEKKHNYVIMSRLESFLSLSSNPFVREIITNAFYTVRTFNALFLLDTIIHPLFSFR